MIDMKKIYLLLLLLLPIVLNARVPEWVNGFPNNSLYYWGIGICELANVNCREVAKKEAIENIAQQISIKIESNSFLELAEVITETSINTQEYFQKQTQYKTQSYLQELQIYDTYQDKKNYYVCYRLEKTTYKAHLRSKSEEIAQIGYNYLQQARQAESNGNLETAISIYQKGLEAVEDWLFLDLSYMSENVPIQLYIGYISVFDGLTLSVQPENISVKNFKELNVEIVASLSKNNTLIKNFPLVAQFDIGAGRITNSSKTNDLGEGYFYLSQLYSKDALQTIIINVDKSIIKSLPAIYQNVNTIQRLPEVIVKLDVEQQDVLFYINAVDDNMPALVRQISSILTTDNFEITTNLNDATHIIEISTNMNKGGIVTGDLGNLTEYFAALSIILKGKNNNVLLQYAENDVRILIEETAPRTLAVQQATKEIIKRFKRNFPQKLSKINIR